MNCKKAETLMVEYLYQELPAAKTVEVEKHLQSCDGCAKTLESWRAIHGGFQNSDYPEAAPLLKQKLLAAARQEISRKPSFFERFSFVMKPAFVLPVAIFALLAFLYFPYQATKSSKIAMSKELNSPAGMKTPVARSDSPQQDKLGSLNKVGDDENYGQRQKSEVTGSEDSLRDSAAKEEQAAVSQDLVSERERQNQPSEFDEKKSVAAAPAPSSESVSPASKPTQPEAMQKDYQGVAGGLVYKSQAAQKNDVIFERAQMMFKNNELGKGKQVAQEAIDQDESRSLASQFHQAGITYQQQHEDDKAILQFSLVVKNYPDYPQKPDVLLRLGDSYRELGQYEEAQTIYQQLLELQPSNKTAAERLTLLSKRKEAEEQLRSLGYVENPDQ